MDIVQIRDAVIAPLNQFLLMEMPGVMIIEADQDGDRPKGPHATYKITSPHIKDVGMPFESVEETDTTVFLRQDKSFKVAFSINAYAVDIDESISLATRLHEWFDFIGQEVFEDNDLALVEIGNIENRDAFIVDGYERRNGFDVIIRAAKTVKLDVGYIEKVEINDKIYTKE